MRRPARSSKRRAGEKIAAERARDFARAVLELDEIRRLALAVLDGGLFMGSRVMDLASAYLAGVEEADGTRRNTSWADLSA